MTKSPFRQQASEYDCVPTSIINALTYLFEREEIPPTVVQRVYLYCLDMEIPGQTERGSSGLSVQMVGNWLGAFKQKKFSVTTTYIWGSDVNFGPNNRISRTINDGGVALIRLRTAKEGWHYVLALGVKNGYLDCFDPLPKDDVALPYVEFLRGQDQIPVGKKPADGQVANLRLQIAEIDVKSNRRGYGLGTHGQRECLLIVKDRRTKSVADPAG